MNKKGVSSYYYSLNFTQDLVQRQEVCWGNQREAFLYLSQLEEEDACQLEVIWIFPQTGSVASKSIPKVILLTGTWHLCQRPAEKIKEIPGVVLVCFL